MSQDQKAAKPTYRRVSTSNTDGVQGRTRGGILKVVLILAAILAIAAIVIAICFAVQQPTSVNELAESEGDVMEAGATSPMGFDSGVAEQGHDRTVTLSFAGDCTLGTDAFFNPSTSFNAKYDSVNDPAYFLANVAPIFREDDVTVVNMEGTLTESTTRVDKKFAFKGPAEYANILALGDVEVAGFANNHDSDYGQQSHADTVEALENAGLIVASEDKIAYCTVNDVKVAIIAAYELARLRAIEQDVASYISAAQEQGAEIIVVYFHWGIEREYTPDANQIYLAHAAIDAGADMVVGSHPHVIQGSESYNDGMIFYSLGNFCYGGHSGPSDMDSMIVQATFTLNSGGEILDEQVKVIPCLISSASGFNNYQPTPAEGDELARIEAKLEQLNANVQTALASYTG